MGSSPVFDWQAGHSCKLTCVVGDKHAANGTGVSSDQRVQCTYWDTTGLQMRVDTPILSGRQIIVWKHLQGG